MVKAKRQGRCLASGLGGCVDSTAIHIRVEREQFWEEGDSFSLGHDGFEESTGHPAGHT